MIKLIIVAVLAWGGVLVSAHNPHPATVTELQPAVTVYQLQPTESVNQAQPALAHLQ